jgi:bifunctional DNase/RNase
MIETTVDSIRVSLVTQNRVVILKEIDGTRHLPIWIGGYEAEAIATELQGVTPARPLPYDLMREMISRLDARIDRILISDLNNQVFFARIVLEHHGQTIEIDSRPSDAIALAVRTGSRILVEDAIMEQAGVPMDTDDDDIDDMGADFPAEAEADAAPAQQAMIAPEPGERTRNEDDRLGVFRDFINSLDLDDFDKKRSG